MSNVAGYILPPPFQVKSTASDDKRKQINTDLCHHIPNFHGIFDSANQVVNDATVSGNTAAGMDADELAKCFELWIVKLYSDAKGIVVPGEQVLILADSGPGQHNKKMLALLCARGFYYVLTGIQNTTHVIQASNQNYGLFMTIYHMYLEMFKHSYKQSQLLVHTRQTDIHLVLVFGEKHDLPGAPLLLSAFDAAFACENSNDIWRTIAIFPIMQEGLQEEHATHKLIMLPDGTIAPNVDLSSLALVKL